MYPFKGTYPITQEYGVKNCAWYSSFPDCMHPGIDFGCPEGTELLSIDDGVVKQSYFDGGQGYGYGNLIVIQYDGYVAYYGHLSVRHKQAGDKIKAGEAIGLSGNTGLSTGSHLHFEIRVAGVPVNPKPYLENNQEEMTVEEFWKNEYPKLLVRLAQDKFIKRRPEIVQAIKTDEINKVYRGEVWAVKDGKRLNLTYLVPVLPSYFVWRYMTEEEYEYREVKDPKEIYG